MRQGTSGIGGAKGGEAGGEAGFEASCEAAEGDLSPGQYARLAAFRYRLRRFLAFSEAAAARAGLPPQQHQALLALAGRTEADPPTVGFLAEHLLVAPHTAAELVARMVAAGLLTKARALGDRRRVELAPTPRAEALLRALTAAHLAELRGLEPALRTALTDGPDGPGTP